MSLHLVLHGLAVKKRSDAAGIVELVGLDPDVVQRLLTEAVSSGRAVLAQGQYTLAALARVALDAEYSREYAALRTNAAFVAAYEAFERINGDLKTLITDWQTIEIGGARVRNEHADRHYDLAVINRLGKLHERAARILQLLANGVPRFNYYERGLLRALERAEDGDIQWISDARIASYHTLWFELHEDLLRLLGRERAE